MSIRAQGGHGRSISLFGTDASEPRPTSERLRAVHEPESGRTQIFRSHPVPDSGLDAPGLYQLEEVDELVGREVLLNAGAPLFLEESSDYLGYTLVDVTWELPHRPPDAELGEIREEAFRRAQWFVRQYRLETDEIDVRIPDIRDSPVVLLAGATEYRFDRTHVEATFAVVHRQFRWQPAEASGIAKPEWGTDKKAALAKRLRSEAPIEVGPELLLEARQLSRVQQQHRLAVIVGSSAFEALIRDLLLKECGYRTVTQLPMRDSRMTEVAEAVANGDLRSELLGSCAKHLVGGSIKDCSEYQEWFRQAHELRNAIIHRSQTRISQSDAENALKVIKAYVAKVAEFLEASRQGLGTA
jgi:hypothetical protein